MYLAFLPCSLSLHMIVVLFWRVGRVSSSFWHVVVVCMFYCRTLFYQFLQWPRKEDNFYCHFPQDIQVWLTESCSKLYNYIMGSYHASHPSIKGHECAVVLEFWNITRDWHVQSLVIMCIILMKVLLRISVLLEITPFPLFFCSLDPRAGI